MWRHRNSALHDTEAGKVLIVEGDINRTVIQEHAAGASWQLRSDIPLIRIQLEHLIAGTLADKQQWLESMEVAHLRFQKKQDQEKREQSLMEKWVGYQAPK